MDGCSEPRSQASARRSPVSGLGVLALLVVMLAAGCVGPKALQHTRLKYNDVFRQTNDEQLLLNIVRLRYADSPVFIDLPNITSQFEVSGTGLFTGGLDGAGGASARSRLAGAELAIRDTPTLSYHPREGQEIARSLLNPLSTELFRLVNTGANTEQIFLIAVNDINDITNAERATQLTPTLPDDNLRFRHIVGLIAELRRQSAIELAVNEIEKEESDPIAASTVQGRDVVQAARDGLVFRTDGSGSARLLKKEKTLVLRVLPGAVDSPLMRELVELLNLAPGRTQYRIRSELSEDASHPAGPLGNETIFLNMRSIHQIGAFLSKGVNLPEEHVARGIAPMLRDDEGHLFDWRPITAGIFQVCSSKHRPRDSEVAVQYRGYWFYIAESDVQSRATLAIFEMLFDLQESEGGRTGPLLTLPVGG